MFGQLFPIRLNKYFSYSKEKIKFQDFKNVRRSHKKEIEILSKKELDRTIKRLASQILEKIANISSFLLIGIPSRGVYLYKLLAKYLEERSGQQIENGCLDSTFHIDDDFARVGTRFAQVTESPC